MKFLIISSFAIFLLMSCSQQEDPLSIEIDTPKLDRQEKSRATSEVQPKAFDNAMKVVDKLPLFGGCVTKTCSDEKLIKYLYENVSYPQEARSSCLEGRVFVQFIVQIDGSVSDVFVARDIGGGAGIAAKQVVEAINDLDIRWSAGENGGVKVPVMYTLPVIFKLE